MIICSCRAISHTQFTSAEELIARLKQRDVQCATCLNVDAVKRYTELYERNTKSNIRMD